MEAKIGEFESHSKIQNIRHLYRGINDFKKCHQPRNNILKDEKGDFVTDSHNILVSWRKHFAQILNIHEINDVRHTEIPKLKHL